MESGQTGLQSPSLSQKSQELCSLGPREEQGTAADLEMGPQVRGAPGTGGKAPALGGSGGAVPEGTCRAPDCHQGREAWGADNQRQLRAAGREQGATTSRAAVTWHRALLWATRSKAGPRPCLFCGLHGLAFSVTKQTVQGPAFTSCSKWGLGFKTCSLRGCLWAGQPQQENAAAQPQAWARMPSSSIHQWPQISKPAPIEG